MEKDIKKFIEKIDSYETLKQIKTIFEDLLQNEKEEIFIASLTEEIKFMDKILETHTERIKREMSEEGSLIEEEDGFISGDIKGLMNRIIEEPIHKEEKKEGKIIYINSTQDGEELEYYEEEPENEEKEQKFFEWVREKMNGILVRNGLKSPDLRIVEDDEDKEI